VDEVAREAEHPVGRLADAAKALDVVHVFRARRRPRATALRMRKSEYATIDVRGL